MMRRLPDPPRLVHPREMRYAGMPDRLQRLGFRIKRSFTGFRYTDVVRFHFKGSRLYPPR